MALLCQLYPPIPSSTASHPAHTLQAEVHWPQGSRSRHKGVVYMCVCLLRPWAFTWASVCLCVLVEAGPWELRVGASWLQQWLLPWQPRKENVLNEWVGEGCTVAACVWQGSDCVYTFKYLNSIKMVYGTWYTPPWMLRFLGLLTLGFLCRQQQ